MKRSIIYFLLFFLLVCAEASAGAGNPVTERPRKNYGIGGPPKGAVWILSVGINDYKDNQIGVFKNCESDARNFAEFFKLQYEKRFGTAQQKDEHVFLLIGKNADRPSILKALTTIIDSSKPGDYFVFNFTGFCYPYMVKGQKQTYFAPYGTLISDSTEMIDKGISLKMLSNLFGLVPANNQLFFTEAGPTEDFRKEFIQAIVEKNAIAASFSQKNRVVMVTNGYGMDQLYCNAERIDQGPMNHYLTNLPATLNVYDLFGNRSDANKVVYAIKKNEVLCGDFRSPYFDIYFEKDFLENVRLMMANTEESLRGPRESKKPGVPVIEKKPAKKMALIIASNLYNYPEEWPLLKNPLNDANAVGDTLQNQYGYQVNYLFNESRSVINRRIIGLSKELTEDDQLILYFAGHGDYNDEFLDDGYIVCRDSEPTDKDSSRETYISFNNLSRIINKLPARQVLVLLDVCFGGTFADKVVKTVSPDQEEAFNPNESFESRMLKLKTRRFISSGGKNKVPDKDKDPQFNNHSPFAVLLLEGLRTKGRNNYLTALQLYSIMQDKLPSNPSLGDFGDVQRDSDFLLIVK